MKSQSVLFEDRRRNSSMKLYYVTSCCCHCRRRNDDDNREFKNRIKKRHMLSHLHKKELCNLFLLLLLLLRDPFVMLSSMNPSHLHVSHLFYLDFIIKKKFPIIIFKFDCLV